MFIFVFNITLENSPFIFRSTTHCYRNEIVFLLFNLEDKPKKSNLYTFYKDDAYFNRNCHMVANQ